MKKIFALGSLLLALPVAAESKIPADQLAFFENKIRPVLAESCYECHNSVDKKKKKGKLALDWREPMMAGGSEGKAVIPGNPKDSLLIKSIRHLDDLEMPSKAPKLSDAVIADFEKWITMGAPDPRTTKPTKEDLENSVSWESVRDKRSEWWSFQPLKSSTPQKPTYKDWQQNQIDHFVFAGLKEKSLKPSNQADKYTLIRRLYLTLIGMPPTVDEVNAFVESKDPQAYDKVVDKLLASKEYGERWARHWMDWYRYAGSHGSEGDPHIPYIDTYREYLIRALNEDVSYDQLLKEHLAGDLLAKPRMNKELGINESAIGPAHFRMTPIGFGVTDAYDEQVNVIDNQVDVVSKAMLGLTVSCARCHNHKFDPISQKDFFRFYGVMLSTKQSTVVIDNKEKQQINKKEIAALKTDIRSEVAKFWYSQLKNVPAKLAASDVFKPNLPNVPRPKKGKKLTRKENAERRKKETQVKNANKRKQLVKQNDHPFSAFALKKNPKKIQTIVKDWQKQLITRANENEQLKKKAHYYLDLSDPKNSDKFYTSGNGIDGISPAGSFAMNAEGDQALTGIYPAGVYSHLTSSKHAAVFITKNFKVEGKYYSVQYAGSESQARTPIRNYPLAHGGLHPGRDLKDGNLSWQAGPGKWPYWQGEQAHLELRTAGEIIPKYRKGRSWFGISQLYIGDQPLKNTSANLVEFINDLSSLKDSASIDKAYQTALATILKNWAKGKMSDKEALFLQPFIQQNIFSNKIADMPKSLQAKISQFRQLEKAIPMPTRAPGVIEGQVVDQPLMERGEYKKQGEIVERQFLEIFSNKKYTKKNSGRLELAEDMVSEVNTLKTRVIVNRLWSYVFGKGIVKSTDNFGRLGSKPTHPELLDYLALNFEKNDWSIKSAIRQMVTSRTFKSMSQSSDKAKEFDPENDYLSFYMPRRLDAEGIHDTLMKVAGRNFKRAVYDQAVRNRLNPFLTTFNRPTPVTTVSTRLRSNVPAQALTMMNSFTGNLEVHLSNLVTRDKTLKTDKDKINALFMHCFSRPANSLEIQQCQNYLKQADNNWGRLAGVILNSKEIIYVH